MTPSIRRCLFVLTAVAGQEALAAEAGYYAQPTVYEDRLIFVSEGDLWTANIESGPDEAAPITAYRLTSSDGSESHPAISPDGQMLAFSAEYDGNTDVYLMPLTGGAPTRMTFHPGDDLVTGWSPDGRSIQFVSGRAHPLGKSELWRISLQGGMPSRFEFGECTAAAFSETGSRLAFTRWSNERWVWRGYRGGTAPEIWIGDQTAGTYTKLTDDPANDMFPMWMRGRVYFASDRDGLFNIYSDRAHGGDLQQHTSFAHDAASPMDPAGFDVRWPSAEPRRRASRIVFCQGGGVAILDVTDNSVRRLDVRLASDRVARRHRFVSPMDTLTEYALSPDGSSVLIGARGEVLQVEAASGEAMPVSRSSNAREWGATFLGTESIVLITDATGEQQIGIAPADGTDLPSLVTEDREDWLFPPTTSPDGGWIAFADKTMRLHVLNMATLVRSQVDQAEAGEITDYRFSPDSQWLAYVKPMPNGVGRIYVHALATGQSFPVSDGLDMDSEPRWDPAGRYLYFLSARHFDPLLGDFDMEHVYTKSTRVFAVPLRAEDPPPLPGPAAAAGMDLDLWSVPAEELSPEEMAAVLADEVDILVPDDEIEALDAGELMDALFEPMHIDTDGLMDRHVVLPIEPGAYTSLEAIWGGVAFVESPPQGLLMDDWGTFEVGGGSGVLYTFLMTTQDYTVLAEDVDHYVCSADASTAAWIGEDGLVLCDVASGETEPLDMSSIQIRVDIAAEWRQIFLEAWRMQRDFYWAPNMVGVDWEVMRTKYESLLPRVGTRMELNDLIRTMINELRVSHAYIMGGEEHDDVPRIDVGLLGVNLEPADGGVRISHIIPGQDWSEDVTSPLSPSWVDVSEGDYITAINGQPVTPLTNVYDLLQDQAYRTVRVTVAETPRGTNARTIEVEAIGDESMIRYHAWVESNRRYVDEQTNGDIGYVHIPDMGGFGLSTFSRQFFAQSRKRALVIDVRNNGGGFVSQMIIEKLSRRVLGFSEPRHGRTDRYPMHGLHCHMAAIIDHDAGSDGDIFPSMFRQTGLGPLIGTRTWGGVVGIRGDKPFVDFGLSTQPEYAQWDADGGWIIEGVGVEPDIEVAINPADVVDGADPQLDRAIEELRAALRDDPKAAPERPDYPRK